MAPLTHDEIATAVRGRHAWNTRTKEWEIKYRPYRNQWIVLLLTINPRIFAMPMARVIPTKIEAQYEQEEDYQRAREMGLPATLGAGSGSMAGSQMYAGSSLGYGESLSKTGINKRYQAITEIKQPTFQRDTTKNEGNIQPDKGSTIKIAAKKTKTFEQNPYETQIANRMAPADTSEQPEGKRATGFPKVTFAAQQVFNEVCNLSAKVPTWQSNKQNPINEFVPKSEQAYKTMTEEAQRTQTLRDERS